MVLNEVGVLVFIDEDVLEFGLPFGSDVGIVLEEFELFDEEIVEIEGGSLGFLGFVAGEDFGDAFLIGVESGGGVIFGGVALVFLTTDDGLDGFGF